MKQPSAVLPNATIHTVGPVHDARRDTGLAYEWAGRFLAARPWLLYLREDAEQVALQGLVQAAWGFRASRGFRFSTYACWAITNELLDWAERSVPHVNRVTPSMRARGVPAAGLVCLDDPLGTELPERDRGHGRELERIEEAAVAHREVERLLLGLRNPRARAVLLGRFFRGLTLEAIGREQGVTKERVRQIEAWALRRIRKTEARRLWPKAKG